LSKGNAIDLGLTDAFNDLFSTQEERDSVGRTYVMDLPPDQISDFPDHPFKVRMDEEMEQLVESVRERGVLLPALVRPMPEGGYQMVSGHRRKRATELAEVSTLPCIVRELTDDEAIILMVDSNLQREKVLPSERAFAYKMKLEAMKRQGERTDLTSPPLVEKLGEKEKLSASQVGRTAGDSYEQVRRYIRLTHLIPPLLDLVDEEHIAFRPAVELSYLRESEQEAVLEAISLDDATPSLAQAIKMKNLSREGQLDETAIRSMMSEEKPNQKEKYTFQADRLRQYIPSGYSHQQTEEYVVKALVHYQRFLERQRDRER
jgi:ParB family chromosome partitioning protein